MSELSNKSDAELVEELRRHAKHGIIPDRVERILDEVEKRLLGKSVNVGGN